MDEDHLPILSESLSHSKYKLFRLAGTPKTLDNTLTKSFKRSSMAEWFVPCRNAGCGAWNIPAKEFHLDAMIGDPHPDVSEARPGTVCHKCRKPISPRHGHWVHRYRQRRWTHAGYHLPQIIFPFHFAHPSNWSLLCAKREGWGGMALNTFYNEVLGEPIDTGQKLVSEEQLRAASVLPWANNPRQPPREVLSRLKHYRVRVLAVDWGGGGAEETSYTTIALLGYAPDGSVHVLWGKRLTISQEHLEEAREILHWFRLFRCDVLAHDYTGAGIVRETVLVQAGVEANRIMPIQYVRAAAKNLMKFVAPTELHNRAHYCLDKTRSLLYTVNAIKTGLVKFFKYDEDIERGERGLIPDFLALLEEKNESRLVGDIYSIIRKDGLSDDFAHSVNLGCAAIWHMHSAWPDFVEAARVGRITLANTVSYGNMTYGWEQDPAMKGFFNQP